MDLASILAEAGDEDIDDPSDIQNKRLLEDILAEDDDYDTTLIAEMEAKAKAAQTPVTNGNSRERPSAHPASAETGVAPGAAAGAAPNKVESEQSVTSGRPRLASEEEQLLAEILKEDEEEEDSVVSNSAAATSTPAKAAEPEPESRAVWGDGVGRTAGADAVVSSMASTPESSLGRSMKDGDNTDADQIPDMISPLRAKRKALNSLPPAGGGILRLVPIDGISSQLSTEAMKREAGYPTCCSVLHGFVVIGTSHGLVLVFDHMQRMKIILGSLGEADRGAVSSLDMCPNVLGWLVVGHDSGHVVLWDVVEGTMLKVVNDLSQAPITTVRFVELKSAKANCIVADGTGKVWLVSYTRILKFITPSRSLLVDGSAGPIMSVSVLLPAPNVPHPTDQVALVALASERFVYIIGVNPVPEVLLRLPRPKEVDEIEVPYLSWRQVRARATVVREGSGDNVVMQQGRVVHPVLCIGWGKRFRLLKVVPSRAGPGGAQDINLEFVLVGQYETTESLTGCQWLGEEVLVFTNTAGEARVLEAAVLEEVETLDIKHIPIVFNSYFSHADQTTKQCYQNSLTVADSVLYMLGMDKFYACRVLSWEDRINSLVQSSRWMDALAFALDIYQGCAKGVVGLPRDTASLEALLGDRMVALLESYIDVSLRSVPGTTNTAAERTHFSTLGCVCIDFCLAIGRLDMLFENVFAKFEKVSHRGLFLELLEPYIMHDRLTFLPPSIMQSFIEYFSSQGHLRRVEKCILHMDIMSLDIHQVVTLCRKHHLYSALIYVFNKGLADYVTPAEDLSRMLSSTSDPLPGDERAALAKQFLSYLEDSVSGRGHQKGFIPADRKANVRAQLLNYLFAGVPDPKSSHSRPDPLPFLALAREDITGLLFVVACAWEAAAAPPVLAEDPELSVASVEADSRTRAASSISGAVDTLTSWIGRTRESNASSRPPATSNASAVGGEQPSMPSPEPIIAVSPDTITAVLTSHVFGDKEPFTAIQRQHLHFFLARYAHKKVITLTRPLLEKVVYALTEMSLPGMALEGRADDCQEELLQVLHMIHSEDISVYEYKSLLSAVEKAGYHKVSAFLYKINDDYAMVLEAYLKDTEKQGMVFSYIRTLMADPTISQDAHTLVKQAVVEQAVVLVQINNVEAVKMLFELFPNSHEEVMKVLDDNKRAQFWYLNAILGEDRKRITQPTMSELLERSGIKIDTTSHEAFVELCCQHAPREVYQYLISHDKYRLDECLKWCQQFRIDNATAYLLERTGDVGAALTLMLEVVTRTLAVMKDAIFARPDDVHLVANEATMKHFEVDMTNSIPEIQAVRESITTAIQLCQRNSARLDEFETESLWFRVLDSVVVPDEAGHGDAGMKLQSVVTALINLVLHSMIGSVSLQSILSKITADHGREEFRKFKGTILGMIEIYSYERSIYSTANQLMFTDLKESFNSLKKGRSRALKPRQARCLSCNLGIQESSDDSRIAVFDCGHIIHLSCLGDHHLCPICSKEDGKNEGANRIRRGINVGPGNRPVSNLSVKQTKTREKTSVYEMYTNLGRREDFVRARKLTLAPQNDDVHPYIGERRPGAMHREAKYYYEVDSMDDFDF